MKYVFIILLICVLYPCSAQKYILLDKAMSQPAFFSNKISVTEKFKGFFPVEKKNIPQFLKALEEISQRLTSKKNVGKAKNYQMGCTQFTGITLPLATGERFDYVLSSTCDNIKISMHLCNGKLDNESNAYFINTWLKYIKNALKQKEAAEQARFSNRNIKKRNIK